MTQLRTSRAIGHALTGILARIKTSDGFETDIGARVFRGRTNIAENLVPCAVLIEGNDRVIDRPGRLTQVAVDQTYVIAAYLPCDPNNPNDAAHEAIADIKRAIFSDADFTRSVVRVSYKGKDIGARADGRPIVFATVEIDVTFVEELTAT